MSSVPAALPTALAPAGAPAPQLPTWNSPGKRMLIHDKHSRVAVLRQSCGDLLGAPLHPG